MKPVAEDALVKFKVDAMVWFLNNFRHYQGDHINENYITGYYDAVVLETRSFNQDYHYRQGYNDGYNDLESVKSSSTEP